MRDYHRLLVWTRAHQLTVAVYRLTGSYPRDERFGLTAQMRRAAGSIPTNIAEGAGRPSDSEFARFLGIAAASVQELHYQLELSQALGFGVIETNDALLREAAEVRAMITALRSKVVRGSNRPGVDAS
jgi:four helix bundle protein